jgi:hypothetical protein
MYAYYHECVQSTSRRAFLGAIAVGYKSKVICFDRYQCVILVPRTNLVVLSTVVKLDLRFFVAVGNI